jgi:hypothetical protein
MTLKTKRVREVTYPQRLKEVIDKLELNKSHYGENGKFLRNILHNLASVLLESKPENACRF